LDPPSRAVWVMLSVVHTAFQRWMAGHPRRNNVMCLSYQTYHSLAVIPVINHRSSQAEGEGCFHCVHICGKWYTTLILRVNYHIEHHDFPDLPIHWLGGGLQRRVMEFCWRGEEQKDKDIDIYE